MPTVDRIKLRRRRQRKIFSRRRRRMTAQTFTSRHQRGVKSRIAKASRDASNVAQKAVTPIPTSLPTRHISSASSDGRLTPLRPVRTPSPLSTCDDIRRRSKSRRASSCTRSLRLHGDTAKTVWQEAEARRHEEIKLKRLSILIERSFPGEDGPAIAKAFREATVFPPITASSLSELEIEAMESNVRLRHDINFDRELSFRPNFDGTKGMQKKVHAETYWQALLGELWLYAYLSVGVDGRALSPYSETENERLLKAAQRRIPNMFDAIKSILLGLVPKKDHFSVEEQLDQHMIMQQIEKGVCDFVRMSQWMACLLKSHCAPIRDQSIDRMVEKIESGVQRSETGDIVEGLRELFGILEAMKLDVANHQIRTLRFILINDFINFEKDYYRQHMPSNEQSNYAHAWFYQQRERHLHLNPRLRQLPSQQANEEIFIRSLLGGVVHAVHPYTGSTMLAADWSPKFPSLSDLDHERLRAVSSEIAEQVYVTLTLDAFTSLCRYHQIPSSVFARAIPKLQLAFAAIASHNWYHEFRNLALEIARTIQNLATSLSPTTACRNLSASSQEKCNQTHPDAALIAEAEELLAHIYRTGYLSCAHAFEVQIGDLAMRIVSKFRNKGPLELYHELASPMTVSSSVVGTVTNTEIGSGKAGGKVQSIARRMAHIGILQWRVWGELVYLPEEETELDSLSGSTSCSGTSTPTLKADSLDG